MANDITPDHLRTGGSWQRAWGGRLLHYFFGSSTTPFGRSTTLCGNQLNPHSHSRLWQHMGYPKCRKCLQRYEDIAHGE